MEFPDLKIDGLANFFKQLLTRGDGVDGAAVDIQAYFIIIALFMISFAFRSHGKKIDKGTIRCDDLDRTIDENTDAMIDLKREIRILNKNFERYNDDAINKKFQ